MRAITGLLLLLLVPPGTANAAGFADIGYGPHPVGYRSLLRSDPSRTFVDDGRVVGQRPVRIDLWYPARKESGKAILFREYVAADGGVTAVKPELLETVMRAARGAAFGEGSFPLVVYAHTETCKKAILAEYLASHGFVFASPAVLGTYDKEIDPGMTDVETQARDLEFTIGTVGALAAVDSTRVATAGMSFGALSALLVAMRNGNVDAVMSFDGGIGSTPNVENFGFERSPFHDTTRLRVPILHLFGPKVPGTQLDYLRSLVYAERYFAPFEPLDHSDFSGAAVFTDDGAKHAAFGAVLDTVRSFLNRVFRGSSDAFPSTVETLAAKPAPPTIEEVRHLVRHRGAKALRERLQPYPLEILRKTASWLNDYGKAAEAREVLAIAVESYPQSARAHFGLAVILINLGDSMKAAKHFARSLELAPTDPLLDEAARKRIIDSAAERLKLLRPLDH